MNMSTTCGSTGGRWLAAAVAAAWISSGPARGADLTWDATTGSAGAQDGAGSWDTGANNWWTGSANALWNNATPDTAYIGAGNAAGATLTIAAGMSAAALNLRAPGSGSYTLTGGDLTLGAGGLSTLRPGPVLDAVSVGAAGAYSLRKLRSAYAGAAVRVRRSSDDAEQDIGFTASGDLDTGALTTFLGADTAYVRTWYDQSSNSRHGQQTAAADQPILQITDGRWALVGDGTDYFALSGVTVANMTAAGASGTALLVVRAAAINQYLFGYTGTGRWSTHLNYGDSTLYFDAGGTTAGSGRISIANSGNNNVWQQYTLWRNGVNKAIRWGGSQRTAAAGAAQSAATTGGWEVMGVSGAAAKARSPLTEYLQFASGLATGDMLLLEWSQSAYWGLAGPTFSATVNTPITLGASQGWDIGAGHTVTVGGAIGGAGFSLTINGASGLNNTGTLLLGGANTYDGGTTISGGTVQRNASDVLPDTGTVTVNGTAVFNTVGASYTDTIQNLTLNSTGQNVISGLNITGTLSIQGGTTHDLNSSASATAATMSMSGGSVLRLGANSGDTTLHVGSGGLTMDGATLQFGQLGGAYTAQVNLGGNFTGSSSNAISNPNAAGPRLLDLQGATRTFDITGGATTIAPVIQNGGLTKTGAGTLILTGANTYGGATTLSGGTLVLDSAGAIGSSGTINFNGGALRFSAANTTDYSARFGASAGQAYNLDTAGQDVTLATALTSSDGTLTKQGAGTLTLSGGNTYGGGTTVNGGTLKAPLAAALPGYGTAGKVTVAGGATLVVSYGGAGEWAGGDLDALLANNGAGFAAGAALALDTANGSASYGSIAAASLGLTKSGANTLTLTGANTYGGGTRVSAGTLALGAGSSLAATPSITVADGAVLDTTASGGLTLGATQTLTAGRTSGAAADINGNLACDGTLNVAGTAVGGTLTVNGDLNLTGSSLVFDLGTAADQIVVQGQLNVGVELLGFSDFTFGPLPGFSPTSTYVLIDAATLAPGCALDPADLHGTIDGLRYSLTLVPATAQLVLVSEDVGQGSLFRMR